MPGFTFLHAADLHLDSPLIGLRRYDGAPEGEIRVASRRAFEGLVRLAIDERAAFVLLAGDVFDGEWRDYNTGIFFNRELSRLERAGVRVFLVHGNHDAGGQMSRSLRLPPNSRLLSADAPETVRIEELRVAIHGQSFDGPRVTQNLAASYPAAFPGYFNIGLLHTALDGREGHLPYAPCKVRDLIGKGYDYWALGHVHRREEVSRAPWIVFPGNLQGRHARETGPKGCSVVRVEEGIVTEVRHAPLDVVRWSSVVVDVGEEETPQEIVEHLAMRVADEAKGAEGRLLAVRVRATGTGGRESASLAAEPDRWRAELHSRIASLAGHRVWVEKVRFDIDTRPASTAGRENIALLEEILAELAREPGDALSELVKALQAKVGADAPKDEDSPFSAQAIERARSEAVATLAHRLRRSRGS